MIRLILLHTVLSLAALACVAQEPPLVWDSHHWTELDWNQTISRTKSLPAAERARLVAAIVRQLRDFGGLGSEQDMRKIAAETRIKRLDLNGDGRPEIIAQAAGDDAICSPTGNCAFWVFIQHENGYRLLLSAQAQTFTVQPTRSKQFSDLVLGRHSSATESELRVYRFNGQRYTKHGCYLAEWTRLGPDDEYHDLKEPDIVPCNGNSD